MSETVSVLLVDDDEDDYRLTKDLLAEIPHTRFALKWVLTFEKAAEEMKLAEHDIFLVDYRLGKDDGLQLLSQFANSKVPIIILTGQDDRAVDLQAMRLGAMDYLVKGHIDPPLLERSIRYSIARKRTEEALRQAQEQLEARVVERTAELTRLNRELQRSDRLKDEFLATLSHELRTPLTAILGWSRLLKTRTITGAKVDQAIEVIERNAEMEARLVEDILDASRIVSGKLKLESESVDLKQVVKLVVESWRPAADAKKLVLSSELRPVPTIKGSSRRLQQVFSNLLSNSIKFTPAGGQITVSVLATGDHIQVKIADSGAGIAPEFLPHVFDRFRQADGSTTRKHGGLGLGLAIVRHLVEMHGGSVMVESAGENQGTTFTVNLPVSPQEH
jgi:signal transduction histidine kinase